jgi:TolB protein
LLRLMLCAGLLSVTCGCLAGDDQLPKNRLSGQIVYSTSQIFTISAADPHVRRQLTRPPGPHFDPEFSPDGTKIVYRDSHLGINHGDEIYMMDSDGANKVNLTRTVENDWSPTFSPNGRRIAYASENGTATVCVWLMNADGSHKRRLTDQTDEYPSWSADGLIAFSRLSSGNGDIFVIRPDGSGVRELTAGLEQDESPAFSPDGRWIAFERGFEGHRDLWLMRADGSHAHPIVATARDEVQPSWSPDGDTLLYARDGHLYSVSRDGSNPKPLGVQATFADWAPARTPLV